MKFLLIFFPILNRVHNTNYIEKFNGNSIKFGFVSTQDSPQLIAVSMKGIQNSWADDMVCGMCAAQNTKKAIIVRLILESSR